jgi:SAM-dependent methyltransferase
VTSASSRHGLSAALARAARRARHEGSRLRRLGGTQARSWLPAGPGRELEPGRLAREEQTVTNVLYGRLSEQDLAAAEQAIRDEPGAWQHYFKDAERATDRDLLLALGVWVGSRELIERTGLVRAEPPEDVHAMTRGAQNAAGGLYEANMVIDALLSAGGDIHTVDAALDFGCSSGRVLKPLAAAFPWVTWRGCDPNAAAVAWAAEHLPGIEFFRSGNAPPLSLPDESLDLAYAISIWSHFEPGRGLEWFEEMRRVLRPGGYLVTTTHGPTSVAHYMRAGLRSPEQSGEIAEALFARGSWYAAEFGATGDWGVVDPSWGTAFLAPEWLLTQLCPRWRVLEYAPGRNQENQDLFVLQRV